MQNSNIACAIIFVLSAFLQCVHNLDYSDLEALGITCANLRDRYKCAGQRSRLGHDQRGCECDTACSTFKDCCINADTRRTNVRSSTRDSMTCVQVGKDEERGVYAINTCLTDWIGPAEVRRKCEGPVDMSDPLNAAPVTSVVQAITYRNRYCAECNSADLENLRTFQLKLACPETDFMSDEEIYADLRYDSELDVWGLDRINSLNTTDFIGCNLIFDVPGYLNNSVRFCHMNLISSCPQNFQRQLIRRACEDYTAVVTDAHNATYKNPHCAICNGRTVGDLSCNTQVDGRGRPMSFALLLDVNTSDGDQVGVTQVATPSCPSNQLYDPYKKVCRKLVCALPGYVIVGDRCVRG